MKIIFDNIIYSLQRAGGISLYWTELIKRFQKNKNVIFFENKNTNIFRKNPRIQHCLYRVFKFLLHVKDFEKLNYLVTPEGNCKMSIFKIK